MAFQIIGDQDTVIGYRFAGVTGVSVDTAEEARRAFREALAARAHKILLLTEQVEQMINQEVTEHRLTSSPPFVVIVKDIAGTQVKRKSLEATIYEAIGIKIGVDGG